MNDIQKDVIFYRCLIKFIKFRCKHPDKITFSHIEIEQNAGSRFIDVVNYLMQKNLIHYDELNNECMIISDVDIIIKKELSAAKAQKRKLVWENLNTRCGVFGFGLAILSLLWHIYNEWFR